MQALCLQRQRQRRARLRHEPEASHSRNCCRGILKDHHPDGGVRSCWPQCSQAFAGSFGGLSTLSTSLIPNQRVSFVRTFLQYVDWKNKMQKFCHQIPCFWRTNGAKFWGFATFPHKFFLCLESRFYWSILQFWQTFGNCHQIMLFMFLGMWLLLTLHQQNGGAKEKEKEKKKTKKKRE